MKTIPFCSALATAAVLISSSLTSLAASSSTSSLSASAIVTLRSLRLPPPMFENRPFNCSAISSMPGGPMISNVGRASASSISISLSASRPSRKRLRMTCRAVLSAGAVAVPKSLPE